MSVGFGDEPFVLRAPSGFTNQGTEGGTGTETGTVSIVSDTNNGGTEAFSFNGSSYLQFNRLGVGIGDFSIGLWLRHDNPQNAGNDVLVAERQSSSPDEGFALWLEDDVGDNTLQIFIDDGPGTATGNSNTNLAISTWYHVVVVVDRDGLATFYVNNVSHGTVDLSGSQGTLSDANAVLRIGADWGGSNTFEGLADDIRVGYRAWSTDEVSEWFTGGRGFNSPVPDYDVLTISRNHNPTNAGRLLLARAEATTGLPVANSRDLRLVNPLCHVGAAITGGDTIWVTAPGNFNGSANATERENGIIMRGALTADTLAINWQDWQSIERGEFGYSKIDQLDDNSLAVVYERWDSDGLQFKRYTINGTPTRPAIRSYDFSDAGNELVDIGSDSINADNSGVTFSGGEAVFDGSSHLGIPNTGQLAYAGRDIWHGVRFEFDGLKVTNTGARQVLLGTVNTGTAELLEIFVDTSADATSFEQGRIVVVWRLNASETQKIYTAAASYTAGVAFDLAIDIRQADNTVSILIDGVAVSTTAASQDIVQMDDELAAEFDFRYLLGSLNNRGTPSFRFTGSMTAFRYYGQSQLITQVENNTIIDVINDTERIPSMVESPSGDILIAFEQRLGGATDDTASDLKLAKSTDNGATWTISTIQASASSEIHQDANLVYDINNRLHIMYLNRSSAATVAAIYAGTHTADWKHRYSDDDGDTWSSETDITASLSVPSDWTRVGLGSDGGLLLPDGRIVVYGWRVLSSGSSAAAAKQFAVYSDDNGATWTLSGDWGTVGSNEIIAVSTAVVSPSSFQPAWAANATQIAGVICA